MSVYTLPVPVHFTLRSPIIEMGKTVKSLHQAARRLGLPDVGPIVSLSGEECAVHEHDSLADLKIHARGFLIEKNEAISFIPIEIVGFRIVLPNGLPFNIGLSRYPARIETNNGSLSTRINNGQWKSYVQTIKLEPSRPDICVKSHMKALSVLRAAEKLGILTFIDDPYGQWDKQDLELFSRLCAETVAAH